MDPSPPPSTTADTQQAATWGQKLRLMCSYGGRILRRPTDNTLFYAGGDTRIIAVDRRASLSLSTLMTRLSKSLLNDRPFVLKYQLPGHDLDTLVSLATDDDLANMIEEHDRLSPSPHRLRLFLFLFPEDGGGGGGGGAGGGGLSELVGLEKTSSFESTGSSASASPYSMAVGSGGGGGGVDVVSIGSDNNLTSSNFRPQAIVYQDASGFVESKVVSGNLFETESDVSDCSHSDLLTPIELPGYMLAKPMDQQLHHGLLPQAQPQYVHLDSQSHYLTRYLPTPTLVASYPKMYQPYVTPQEPVYKTNQPYPVFVLPIGQTQNLYDTYMRRPLVTVSSVAPDPQVPVKSVVSYLPPACERYETTFQTAEYSDEVYRKPAVAIQPVNMLPSDHYPQDVDFTPVNEPSEPVALDPYENTSCISEFEDSMHSQIYKTQPPGASLPSLLQTAANATTAMSKTFSQLHLENEN